MPFKYIYIICKPERIDTKLNQSLGMDYYFYGTCTFYVFRSLLYITVICITYKDFTTTVYYLLVFKGVLDQIESKTKMNKFNIAVRLVKSVSSEVRQPDFESRNVFSSLCNLRYIIFLSKFVFSPLKWE